VSLFAIQNKIENIEAERLNKPGVLTILGYLVISLVAVCLGSYLLFKFSIFVSQKLEGNSGERKNSSTFVRLDR
jgi:hypothetical protein